MMARMVETSSCIHSYHVYRKDSNPAIEELLECERKTMNNQDRYAVAEIIVCSIFIFPVSDKNFPIYGNWHHFSHFRHFFIGPGFNSTFPFTINNNALVKVVTI